MIKIYSKIDPKKLLHIVVTTKDLYETGKERINIVPDNEFIQCAFLHMKKGRTFQAHKHILKPAPCKKIIAQESWIVVQGCVECIFYDTDDIAISRHYLFAGDASFTLDGGHNYIALSDDTIVFEYKTGPYEGQNLDKKFI